MAGGWSQTSKISSSCSAASKKGNSTLALSAFTMHCIFLLGYQTGILPRRAPGVRLGGDVRICMRRSCASRERPSRRKYASNTMPSSGFAMISSTSSDALTHFLKRSIVSHQNQALPLPVVLLAPHSCWSRANLKLNLYTSLSSEEAYEPSILAKGNDPG